MKEFSVNDRVVIKTPTTEFDLSRPEAIDLLIEMQRWYTRPGTIVPIVDIVPVENERSRTFAVNTGEGTVFLGAPSREAAVSKAVGFGLIESPANGAIATATNPETKENPWVPNGTGEAGQVYFRDVEAAFDFFKYQVPQFWPAEASEKYGVALRMIEAATKLVAPKKTGIESPFGAYNQELQNKILQQEEIIRAYEDSAIGEPALERLQETLTKVTAERDHAEGQVRELTLKLNDSAAEVGALDVAIKEATRQNEILSQTIRAGQPDIGKLFPSFNDAERAKLQSMESKILDLVRAEQTKEFTCRHCKDTGQDFDPFAEGDEPEYSPCIHCEKGRALIQERNNSKPQESKVEVPAGEAGPGEFSSKNTTNPEGVAKKTAGPAPASTLCAWFNPALHGSWRIPKLKDYKSEISPDQNARALWLFGHGFSTTMVANALGLHASALKTFPAMNAMFIAQLKSLEVDDRKLYIELYYVRQMQRAKLTPTREGLAKVIEPAIEPSNKTQAQKDPEKVVQSNAHQIEIAPKEEAPAPVVKRWGPRITAHVIQIIKQHPGDPAGVMLKHIHAANTEYIVDVRGEDLMEHWAALKDAAVCPV